MENQNTKKEGTCKALPDAGIVAHPRKNVDEQLSETAIGVDFDAGKLLVLHISKLWELIFGVTYIIKSMPLASNADLQAIVGHFT